MTTCPCGFVAAADVAPTSADWHRQHRDHHLARYPNVDQQTRDALAQLIAMAEAGRMTSSAPLDQRPHTVVRKPPMTFPVERSRGRRKTVRA